MKKFVRILLAAMLALLLTACSNKGRQLTITGGGVESVHLGPTITAVANIDFSNPSHKVEVSGISGKLKNGESPLLDLKAEDFTIPARSDSQVAVPVEASLEPGVGLLSIMKLIRGNDFEGLTVDLTFTASGFLGIKKTQTLENIPVKNIIGLL